jgi:hypothetical protein
MLAQHTHRIDFPNVRVLGTGGTQGFDMPIGQRLKANSALYQRYLAKRSEIRHGEDSG